MITQCSLLWGQLGRMVVWLCIKQLHFDVVYRCVRCSLWVTFVAVAVVTAILSWHFLLLSGVSEFFPSPECVCDWCSCSSGTCQPRKLTEAFHLCRFPHIFITWTDRWHPEGAPNKCIYHCISLILRCSFFTVMFPKLEYILHPHVH